MSRFLVWVALLGLVLLGGFPGATPARAAPPAQDPKDLCTLLPQGYGLEFDRSEAFQCVGRLLLDLRPEIPGKDTSAGHIVINWSSYRSPDERSVVGAAFGNHMKPYFRPISGFGERGFELPVGTMVPSSNRPGASLEPSRYYYLAFTRGDYSVYAIAERQTWVELFQRIARATDDNIRALSVTPPGAKPKAEPKPEPTLTAKEAEKKLLDALSGLSEKDLKLYIDLVDKRGKRLNWMAAGEGMDKFWGALGKPQQPTQAQEAAKSVVDFILRLAHDVDNTGRPWYPTVRAAMPVLVKLGVRASVDPDALTALKRLSALLIGMDARAALGETP